MQLVEVHTHIHPELYITVGVKPFVAYCLQVLSPLIDLIKNDILMNANTTQFVKDSANNLVLPVRHWMDHTVSPRHHSTPFVFTFATQCITRIEWACVCTESCKFLPQMFESVCMVAAHYKKV